MATDSRLHGYFLRGVEGEYLLVVRTEDEDLLCQIIGRLASMRQPDIKALGVKLQEQTLGDNRRGSG